MFEKYTLSKPMLTITMLIPPVLRETFTLIPVLLLLAQAIVTKPNFTKTCQQELLYQNRSAIAACCMLCSCFYDHSLT